MSASGGRAEQPGWLHAEARWLEAAVWLVVLLLCVVPLVRLCWAAVVRPAGIELDVVWATWTTRSAIAAVVNTVLIGATSAFAATAIGTAVAIALAVTDVAAKRVLALLLVGALLVAPQVMALAFKTMLGPASPLLSGAGLGPPPGTPNPMLGIGGVIVVLTLHHIGLAAITVATGLAAIPKSLIEAASLDGASSWRIVRFVVLPVVRAQIVAALLVTFVAGAGNFGIPALLGMPVGVQTLPTLIYRQLSGFGPSVLGDVAGLSLLAALLALAGVAVGRWFAHAEATPLGSDTRMQPFWRLGKTRWLVGAGLWLLVAVATVLPVLSLIATALVPAAGLSLTRATATPAKFHEVLLVQSVTTRALRNSVLFAATAAVIVAVLSTAMAYVIERRRGRIRGLLVLLVQIPYAVPGVVLAIAAILLLLKPLPLIGVSLYGTSAIIIIAYVARFLAVALAPISAGMALLERDAEEAAAVFGASLWQRLRYIVVPMLAPAVAAAALLVFLLAFNELTVSALLWSSGTETLGVALLSLEDAGLVGEAAALGVVTIAAVALIMLMLDRLAPWLPEGVLPWSSLAGSRPRA